MSTERGFWNWFLRGASLSGVNRGTSGTSGSSANSTPHRHHSEHPPSASPVIQLAAAVEAFNLRAALDEIGQTQPLLTVDEVTTAIRSAGRHQLPLVESQRRQIQAIADLQHLPPEADLKFTTSWFAPSGYRCEVWWIDLVLFFPNHARESHLASGCSLRIRDHRLRSWHDPSLTVPTEIQRLQADHRWFPSNPPRAESPTHY